MIHKKKKEDEAEDKKVAAQWPTGWQCPACDTADAARNRERIRSHMSGHKLCGHLMTCPKMSDYIYMPVDLPAG